MNAVLYNIVGLYTTLLVSLMSTIDPIRIGCQNIKNWDSYLEDIVLTFH